jgi:ParB family chromosome partitioning protein
LALIENLRREDLNPIEIANGYNRLIEECGITQEQVATKFGIDRTTVTNFLRLLKLPEKIQDSLRKKEIKSSFPTRAPFLFHNTNKSTKWKTLN